MDIKYISIRRWSATFWQAKVSYGLYEVARVNNFYTTYILIQLSSKSSPFLGTAEDYKIAMGHKGEECEPQLVRGPLVADHWCKN